MILAKTLIILGLAGGLAHPLAAWNELEEQSRRAGIAMVEGRFEEAVAIWAQMVRGDPENIGLRLNLGLALHAAGRYREAASQLERVVAARPDSPSATLMLGLCYNRLHLPRQAIPALESALARERRNEDVQAELASAYREDGQYWRAAEMLRVLAPRDPGNPRLWHQLLLCLIALDQEARRQMKAPPVEPKLPSEDCTGNSPACRFVQGQYSLLIERGSAQETPEREWWRHRALERLIAGAIDQLKDVPSPDTCELLAEVYDRLGRYADAVEQWTAALELAPDDRRLSKALARSRAAAAAAGN